MFQVYVITNKINGKKYIGCTERELRLRWNKHIYKMNEGSQCALHKAIRKYGKDNFEINLLEVYKSKLDMLVGEIKYIEMYNTYYNGYNETLGGEGGNTNSGKQFHKEWRLKISKSHIGKSCILRRRFSDNVEKEICKLYIEENRSAYSLSKQFNCYRSTIYSLLKRNNISIRKSKYTGHSNKCNIFSLEQEAEICKIYIEQNVSRAELARKFGCSKNTIRNILTRHNIEN